MKIETGVTYLITTDNWFIAPNGRQYRAAFGTVKGTLNDEEALGIKTNARATNWFISIGNMLIAGCQIHYAVRTNTCQRGTFREERINTANNVDVGIAEREVDIYFADGDAA
jgi:hypothetical protein